MLKSFQLGLRTANVLDLYELAVQSADMQARFLRSLHKGQPRVLGEDFAGPAGIARAWLRLDEDHQAIAVDRDPVPLEHAAMRQREWDLRSDAPSAKRAGIDRLTLRVRDVMEAGDHTDIIAAFNFALGELHSRAQLMTYLRHLLFRLEPGGVFVADVYGGPDAQAAGVYDRAVELPDAWGGGTLSYEWQQVWADPATGLVCNAIHFTLPDGTRIEDAFVYHWRLWGVAELREAMLEAGFRSTEVYESYGDAVDGEGNLYTHPISTRLDEPDEDASVEEPFVFYIAARVN